jgi:preprotein translocase subunit SecE
VAQTKSTQSNPARVGLNRDQGRRAGATASPATRAPLPALGGAGAGRRGRGNPIDFIRDVRSELRKVAWPSQRETINLTVVVIALSVAVGLFLGGVDFVFQELFRFLLGIQSGGSF